METRYPFTNITMTTILNTTIPPQQNNTFCNNTQQLHNNNTTYNDKTTPYNNTCNNTENMYFGHGLGRSFSQFVGYSFVVIIVTAVVCNVLLIASIGKVTLGPFILS